MHIGTIPDSLEHQTDPACFDRPGKISQNFDYETGRASARKPRAWFAAGCAGAALLAMQSPALGEEAGPATSPCGGRFVETIARQQATSTDIAAPCGHDRTIAAVRHYEDAATFDPASGPAIFGSVAVPVSRTPFDARVRRIRPASLSGASGPWSGALTQARKLDRPGQLRHINRWVNDHLAYVGDQALHGTEDIWSTAAMTLGRGRGDCEDYAIAKMALLSSLGFSAQDLFLVLVRDGARRSDHALLAVREGGRLWVLDSTTNEVRESSHVPDYFPVMSFAGGRAWLHGYRVKRAPETLRVAAAATHTDWVDRGR